MPIRRPWPLWGLPLLHLACGHPGAPGPSPTAHLDYSAPKVPRGHWSIQAESIQGDTIVFGIRGPEAPARVRGFSFTLVTDPTKAAWVKMGPEWAREGGLLNLGNVAIAADPKLQFASNREAKLVFCAFQKDGRLPPVDVAGKVIYRFSMKRLPGAKPGEPIPLGVEIASFLPPELDSLQRFPAAGLPGIDVAVGALIAK